MSELLLSRMTGSFTVIYSPNLAATSDMRDCPALLPTLTHDWTRIAEYSHTPLLGRGRHQLPTQYCLAMFDEARHIEGFCQQVCRLLLSVNREDFDKTFLDPLPEVMILLIDVPSSGAHFGRLGQMDSSSIVFKELAVDHRIGLRDVNPMLLHFLEKVHHDDSNTQTLRQSNIFTFSSGENHFGL